MLDSKKFAAILLLAAYIAYQSSDVYVPEKFDEKFFYLIGYGVIRAAGIVSRFIASLGIGNEAYNIRFLASIPDLIPRIDFNVNVKDIYIEGIRVRLYSPISTDSQPWPVMVYFHGGGYFMGSIAPYNSYLFDFVKRLNMTVLSVDYRLAPEDPFPTPTEDCYKVTRHLINNPSEFNADVSRLVLAGDSAGGGIVALLTQRFAKEKLTQPKIQVLIYPLVQLADISLPSYIRYVSTGVSGASRIGMEKFAHWYFGIVNQTDIITEIYDRNEHFGLIDDPSEHKRIVACLDVDEIDSAYKIDPNYYQLAKRLDPHPTELPENSILKQNRQLNDMFKMVFRPEVSPLFAHDNDLVGLPKTYFTALEWDFLKDEGLLYANRLKKAGVDVHISFYENGFHGISVQVRIFKLAGVMQEDLILYLYDNL